MAIMSILSLFHVKASMVLTGADHLLIYNYIRLLLNIIVRPRSYKNSKLAIIKIAILMVRTRLEPVLHIHL